MLKPFEESPSKISMLRHKNEELSIFFLGVFFPTPPLLITYFYDIIGRLSLRSPGSFGGDPFLSGSKYFVATWQF